ncbi:hypothetical protein J4H92_04940 [Leucobacter weissii]|uniref:Uncharacterized protein n=1 Tax=Leucobacter weissii TaxID=1983706 RepID=A0A939MIM8_9MICO|nr:hypothetical protein [Leucobacter weissii]MBO1901291.1 hypothetical protein [Leucobacter weissii]
MFSLLWRFFPGPAWLRVIVLLAVAVALVWVLIAYVYPYVAVQLMVEESTVNT